MAGELWKRFARITFGERGQEGKRIAGLDIDFDIEKTVTSAPNKCSINIFNLNDDSRGLLSQSVDLFFQLEVAYGSPENYHVLFSGDVIRAPSVKKGADWVTKLEAGDGYKDLIKNKLSKSYKKGVSTQKILKDIIQTFKYTTVANLDRFKSRALGGSLVIDEDVTKALNKVILQQGLEWSVQDEILRITSPLEVLDEDIVYLSPSSGLIDSPFSQEVSVVNTKKVASGQSRKDFVKVSGVKFKSLIVPNILPARGVEIASRYTQGQFRCQKVRYSGSTYQNNWYATVDGIPFGD